MSIFAKHARAVLSALLLLAACTFFLPFAVNQPEGEAAVGVTGFEMLSDSDHVVIGGETYLAADKGVSFQMEDGSVRSFVHLHALILLSVIVGLYCTLFDRSGLRKYLFPIAASAVCLILTAWLSGVYGRAFTVAAGDLSYAVAGQVGSGLTLLTVLLSCVLIWASLALFSHVSSVPAEPKAPGKKLAWISRVAVLGAVSAVLFYFEVPIIPPIYKLDLSAVPALIAGFAMGPGASLGVMAVKDLVGLLHTSSMGVGELADFLMSGSMTVAASLIYMKRHTLKGAITALTIGTIVMGAVGALANYFIMIPFYVQVMNMPMDVILPLIANTIPAVDSLSDMIFMAVVPFNLLKGVVLSIVTLLLYKRLSPMLKNL